MSAPTANPAAVNLPAEVLLAVPFDIDLELEFPRLARDLATAGQPAPHLSGRNAPVVLARRERLRVSLGGRDVSTEAREEALIYGFDIGLLLIRFRFTDDLAGLADFSCDAEQLEIEGRPIYAYADARAEEFRSRLAPYARQRYEVVYGDRDVYPVVILPPLPEGADAAGFLDENRAAIVGIVGGEDDWARLSSYALENSELKNLGYYKDEVAVAKEWGALVSSKNEESLIVGLILFAYAQRWALQSFNYLTNHRQDRAFRMLDEAKRMKRTVFSRFVGTQELRGLVDALFEAHEDRIVMLASIRDFTSIPELTQDWHLNGLYQELARTFYLNELYKVVYAKNEELERAYAMTHDYVMQTRLVSLEVWMVVLFVLEGLLLLVWFLSERGH